MKLSTVAAILFALTPIAASVPAFAQTDAMPPEMKAPQSSSSASSSQMAMPAKPPVPFSDKLTVVTSTPEITTTTRTFTLEQLVAMPQQTVTAYDAHTKTNSKYTGPLVSDLFTAIGLVANEKNHSLLLRGFVIASGTDHYRVVYSMAELHPAFTSDKVIIALTKDGTPIQTGMQIVSPVDQTPARWVHGLSVLAFSAVPLAQ